jgi:hypothetical protein
VKRIHWHWTAGAPGINAKESDSYNFVITWPDGEVVPCVSVERQKPPLVNGAYAAHTKGANSWAIGISIDAMAGAVERPFNHGKYPITQKQVDALVNLSRELGAKYGIPVTPETMLSHAEVQGTLGIKQNNKWDIMWLPGMAIPGDPVAVGNKLRAMVKSPPLTRPAPHVNETPKIEHEHTTKPVVAPEPAPKARQVTAPALVVGGVLAVIYAAWETLVAWWDAAMRAVGL